MLKKYIYLVVEDKLPQLPFDSFKLAQDYIINQLIANIVTNTFRRTYTLLKREINFIYDHPVVYEYYILRLDRTEIEIAREESGIIEKMILEIPSSFDSFPNKE